MKQGSVDRSIPLCVDMDGTLLATDTLYEGYLLLLKQNPLFALLLPIYLLFGKARLKAEIAKRVELDVAYLPLNKSFVEHLHELKASGRRLVLATAANRRFAEAVALHLGLFDEIVASDDERNLSGPAKAEALVRLYGEKGFDYAGNSKSDLSVWRHARRAVVVGPGSGSSLKAVEGVSEVVGQFPSPAGGVLEFIGASRPHQWSKNLLLFLPIIAAHRIEAGGVWMQAAVGFVAFSTLASSLYILNDLVDLSADRRHPEKRTRPFASARLPISFGLAVFPFMAGGAFLIGYGLSINFLGALVTYSAASILYSFAIKNIVILDIILLALLYVLRLFAGGVATDTVISFWLLAFSMFLFFSLATIKRYAELLSLRGEGRVSVSGRGYRAGDVEIVGMLGVSSGLISVLVLALYINSEAIVRIYSHPQLIWLLCPLMLYWVGHMWLTTQRGEMHHDPVVFTLLDRKSIGVGLASVIILAIAI